ncbi:phage tail length tape measure family protein [Agrobacterium vaccinii]|uniref:phage tail length tape measure family protein n=1 Tax=Agrobacterium vaccinii TaxID=2735528 RepID=UPI001E52B806|nr:phage tail length tape measure family protein [Agrobacterium vaccinii]UHS61054.1 phage tail length tape measure family protein [Agrobacterium vaccinii]
MAGNNGDDLIISISTDLATVKRALNRLVSDVGQASSGIEKRFASAGKSINSSLTSSMQERINSMVGIGTSAAKEWNGALADQQKELDRLRSKYSPLFSTITSYKNAVSEIRQAHAVGAISANEMTAAIQRERQAALASTAAIKGRNAALKATVTTSSGNSFNTANIAAQFQDIGVTAAMGMSPIQIALQQGTQLSAVLQQIKDSGQGVGQGLAAAFASVISPLSLVTIGVIAAGTAAFQYFSTVMSEGDKSAEVLKEQAELISAVAQRWGDAVPALREYADQLKRAQEGADLRKGVQLLNDSTLADVRKELATTEIAFADILIRLQEFGEKYETVKSLQDAFKQFAEAAKDGKVQTEDVDRVQSALTSAVNSTGIPALSEFAAKFDDLASSALVAAGNVQKVNDAASRMTDVTTWRSYNPTTGKLETNADPWADNIQNPGFMTPEEGPTPERRPSDLDSAKNRGFGTPKKVKTPAKTASDRFTEDLQAIRDRTEALRQEMDLIGLSNEEQTKRRAALDLEQKALADLREEARKKGEKDLESIQLSPEKVAAIEKEAAAYAKQSEELRKVAENQQQAESSARDFYDTAKSGFANVVTGAESLGEALKGLANKFADLMLNSAFDNIFGGKSATGSNGWMTGFFKLLGFADGGYTGSGGKNQPAGIVHKGEVVWSQRDVAMAGGVGAVEAMRKGYANGGAVGVSVPTLPSMKPANSNSAPTITFAPVIDARGADQAAVARLETVVAKQNREFAANVLKVMGQVGPRGVRV